MNRLIPAAAAIFAMTGCAPTPETMSEGRIDAGPCFRPNLVRNFTAPEDQTLYVRTAAGSVFKVEASVCRDMNRALSIALEPVSGSTLCVGDQARLLSPAIGAQACRVRIAARLTAEEIAALPSRDRP